MMHFHALRHAQNLLPGFLLAVLLGMGAIILPTNLPAQSGFYYRVNQGETLDDIARRHRVSAYEIARQNRIDVNARPVAGSRLWIPGGSGSSAPASSPSPVARPSSTPPTNRTASPGPSYSGLNSTAAAQSSQGRIVVQRGESLWSLANRHGTTVADLAEANGLSRNAGLEVGQVLILPGSSGGGRGVGVSPTTATQRPWEDPIASSPVPSRSSPPPSTTTTAGTVRGGMGNIAPPHSGRTSSRGYSWPVEGRVLRRFENRADRKYFGIDIAVPPGTEVRAARDGTVHYAGSTITAYGNMVIVMHEGNVATLYAFNSRNAVTVGQRVTRGQVIGYSGDGGRHNEPHIHFQMRRNGNAIDPSPFLP